MGPYKGLKQTRRIILDCMANVHPIYHIKELMIKRELAKDESLKDENWERFLPHFRKTSATGNKLKKASKKVTKDATAKKKEYTPFPPAQLPSKVDLEIESGEYFLKPEEKARRARQVKEVPIKERAFGSRDSGAHPVCHLAGEAGDGQRGASPGTATGLRGTRRGRPGTSPINEVIIIGVLGLGVGVSLCRAVDRGLDRSDSGTRCCTRRQQQQQ